jgi:hypothetical protein
MDQILLDALHLDAPTLLVRRERFRSACQRDSIEAGLRDYQQDAPGTCFKAKATSFAGSAE